MSSADSTSVTPLYTVDKANRTLPLVRRIVEDIVSDYERWQNRVREIELLNAGAVTDVDRLEEVQRDAQRLAESIESCVRELEKLGIELKGYDAGLVDFPSEMDGRVVYLCWRLGEPSVRFWHEKDAGFAGRQPVAATAV